MASSDGSDRSDRSDGSSQGRPRRLRPSGGYRKLRSFWVSTLIHDGTVSFCDRFVQEGGYSEQLATARIAEREKQSEMGRTNKGPVCPVCGKVMVVRTARKGQRAGSQFWGC